MREKGPFERFGNETEDEENAQVNNGIPELDMEGVQNISGEEEETEEECEEEAVEEAPKSKKKKSAKKATAATSPKAGASILVRILLAIAFIGIAGTTTYTFFYTPSSQATANVPNRRAAPEIIIPQQSDSVVTQEAGTGVSPVGGVAPVAPEAVANGGYVPGTSMPYIPQPGSPPPSSPQITQPYPASTYTPTAPAIPPAPPLSPVAMPVAVPHTEKLDEEAEARTDEQKQLIMELRDQVANLQTAVMSIGDSCSPREAQAAALTAEQQQAVQNLTAENEKLAQTKEFLVAQNKEFLDKNNFLRKSEKDKRMQVEEQQQQIAALKSQVKELEAKNNHPAQQAQVQRPKLSAPDSKLGALPEGWRIIGLCPTLVSLENPNKQITVLLEIGEKIEGVEIKGINIADNVVITSNGVAKYAPPK